MFKILLIIYCLIGILVHSLYYIPFIHEKANKKLKEYAENPEVELRKDTIRGILKYVLAIILFLIFI